MIVEVFAVPRRQCFAIMSVVPGAESGWAGVGSKGSRDGRLTLGIADDPVIAPGDRLLIVEKMPTG
jgi:hypothetical protein